VAEMTCGPRCSREYKVEAVRLVTDRGGEGRIAGREEYFMFTSLPLLEAPARLLP
jgi:hypothetical protein